MITNFTIVSIQDYPDVPTINVEVEFDNVKQIIIIPLLAIEKRKLLYELETDSESIVAILKEHYTRIKGDYTIPIPKDSKGKSKRWREMNPKEKGNVTGALREDISIPKEDLDKINLDI